MNSKLATRENSFDRKKSGTRDQMAELLINKYRKKFNTQNNSELDSVIQNEVHKLMK